MNKSEPSLNSPLIDKLVKDVAAIDTSRDMRSEPNTELTYELNTQQCAEVALYMYAEWEKAMQPPLPIWKSYPEWLRQLKANKE